MENPSNLLAASHVKDNGQWPRQGTRTLEMCNLVLKSIKLLLKIEVHYVLFWTTRQVFPERRELWSGIVCWRLVRKFSNSSEEHVQDCDSQNQQNHSIKYHSLLPSSSSWRRCERWCLGWLWWGPAVAQLAGHAVRALLPPEMFMILMSICKSTMMMTHYSQDLHDPLEH